MMVSSRHLKDLGWGRRVLLADGDEWSLPRMVYGALFACDRTTLIGIGGFDERFRGWGFADTFVAAKGLAANLTIVPVHSASGLHVQHKIRTPLQWAEGRRNRSLYNALIDMPLETFCEAKWAFVEARRRASMIVEKLPSKRAVSDSANSFLADITGRLESPWYRATYWAAIGNWSAARAALEVVREEWSSSKTLVVRILRNHNPQEAIEELDRRAEWWRSDGGTAVQYSLALADLGRLAEAHDVLRSVLPETQRHREFRYLTGRGSRKHAKRAAAYAEMQMLDAAREDMLASSVACFVASPHSVPVPEPQH